MSNNLLWQIKPMSLPKKKTLGFIILRHVNSEKTNEYWKLCYKSIRNFYPNNKILIIDDNSNPQYLTNNDIILYETTIIQSEFHRRGEVLPYYYYLSNKLFDIACIIHDSVFIQQYIDFQPDKYKRLWEFEHHSDNTELEASILTIFRNPQLMQYYFNKSVWNGCFGGMMVVEHDFLSSVNEKFNFRLLLNVITNRDGRMAFERILPCLLQYSYRDTGSYFGDIYQYSPWGITLDERNKYKYLPFLKIWTGR
jgi:hypothetical protein